MKTQHNLKTINPYFGQVKEGVKTFEIRKDDRDFKVGDYLHLNDYDPLFNKLTGITITKKIGHILRDAEYFGLMPGFCIISFEKEFSIYNKIDISTGISAAVRKYMQMPSHEQVYLWKQCGYPNQYSLEVRMNENDKQFTGWIKENNLQDVFIVYTNNYLLSKD